MDKRDLSRTHVMFNKQFGDELSPLHFRFQAVVVGFAKVSGCRLGWYIVGTVLTTDTPSSRTAVAV